MTTRKNDRRFAQDPHYLRNEHLTADRRVNDRRGPVDAIREKLAQQLAEERALNAELVEMAAKARTHLAAVAVYMGNEIWDFVPMTTAGNSADAAELAAAYSILRGIRDNARRFSEGEK